jgi:hypothetical protein
MQKIAISGSWRIQTPEVERDVRSCVRRHIDQGDAIVTGGALGVDSVATDEVLLSSQFQPQQLTVILPTSLSTYSAHYRKRAEEGVIRQEQAETLIAQLEQVQRRATLVELPNTQVNQETYYQRNTAVLEASTELAAFQVNGSPGTQDTIDKAVALGMPVDLHQYLVAGK